MSPGGQNYLWLGTMFTSRLGVPAAKAVSGHAPSTLQLPLHSASYKYVCLLSTSLTLPESGTRLRGTSGPAHVPSSWHFSEEIAGPLHPLGDLGVPSGICRGPRLSLRLSSGPDFTLMAFIPQSLRSGVVAIFCLLVSPNMVEFMFLCSILLKFYLFKEGSWTEISLFCDLHQYHNTMRDWERGRECSPAH